MSPPAPKVAFVTGCSGVTGNAIVEHLIRQPKEEWSKIIISSRSPLRYVWQDPRVRWIGIDFLDPVEKLETQLGAICNDVSHAFFASYVHTDGFSTLRDSNAPLFENFLTSIDNVAGPSLQRVILQTGGKHYGVHLGPVPTPMREDVPRYEDKGENFYFAQEDFMFNLQKQRKWSWNIIRPNAIIGFTPGKNGMSMALTMALYLITCKELGVVPEFPGNRFFYHSTDDCSYAPAIADLSVWSATHEHTKNEAFNHVNGDTFVWRYFFKDLGRYFGIDVPDQTEWKALGLNSIYDHNFKMEDWQQGKQEVWNDVCEKYGGNKEAFNWGTWGFFNWAMGKAWPTTSSMSKARRFGWQRQDDSLDTWLETFRSFENAGVLPRAELLRASASGKGATKKVVNGANGLANGV